jgi:leader peptidase (prepilin peptidase) / N-methyltransferase
MAQNLIIACILLYGLIIGSFLNVVIYRLPRRMAFGMSRSRCPHCGRQIAWHENIPLISYLFLLGRCSACKARISPRYPLIELITAATYFYLYLQFGLTIQYGVYALVATALIVIFFIDLDYYIIPDVITYPGLAIGLACSFLPDGIGITQALIGAIVGGGSLYAVAMLGQLLFKKESMGGGDVKMTAMLGAFLGWQNVLVIFLLSAVIALVVSLAIMAVSAKFRQSRMIPFGPFIAIAAVIAMTHGNDLIAMYLATFAVR